MSVAGSGEWRDSSRSLAGTGRRTASHRVFCSQQCLALKRVRAAEESCLSNVLSSGRTSTRRERVADERREQE
ncbi:hypothetical protein E2C01_077386 [Portunus trituberculatus]|uniref:Uncharacterized protein n=1 Tax=Portunus trituberculatus TaxID=210409 RepID=A0A5B7IK52_PORTR|nr:hypothetical protein [Portunus trituberculatus]